MQYKFKLSDEEPSQVDNPCPFRPDGDIRGTLNSNVECRPLEPCVDAFIEHNELQKKQFRGECRTKQQLPAS